MVTSFYTEAELRNIGLKQVGSNVLISRKASLYKPSEISIGDNVRIDDFCILSGRITIGSNVHISAYVSIYGNKGVVLEDYTGISPRSTIFSAMDDFCGDYLIGPIHDPSMTNVTGGPVVIKKYSQIGTNVVVFPDVVVEEGCAVGAFSLVNKSLESWHIYYGVPVRKMKPRSKGLLDLIQKYGE